jgi:hypothetical protein
MPGTHLNHLDVFDAKRGQIWVTNGVVLEEHGSILGESGIPFGQTLEHS